IVAHGITCLGRISTGRKRPPRVLKDCQEIVRTVRQLAFQTGKITKANERSKQHRRRGRALRFRRRQLPQIEIAKVGTVRKEVLEFPVAESESVIKQQRLRKQNVAAGDAIDGLRRIQLESRQ